MNYGILEEKQSAPTQTTIFDCIDAGTENCPCYLAVTGDCLVCSRLRGKDYCDCSWRGVCIYNEFIQGNRKVNNPRTDFEADIVRKKYYKEDLVVYVLDVGKGFAMKAGRPGSYLFVKARGASRYYDIPISVMKADVEKGQIHLAIKVISTKTKALLAEEERLIIRGPYRNGIQGISAISKKRGSLKSLIIAKGIGIAPGIMISESMQGKGLLDMVIDTDKISDELISDYMESEDGIIKYLSLAENETEKTIKKLLSDRNYDNVILLTSDYYIDKFGKVVKEILPAANVAVSNNFHICCGEGLCGSCSVDTAGGETIKMCKCQFKGEEVLNRALYSKSV